MLKKKYLHKQVDYILADALSFKYSGLFDTMISLETIEHLADPSGFIKFFSDQLKKGGYFIASVPVVPTMDANPYHLQDFSKKSFKKLFIESGFTERFSMIQIQRYKLKDLRKNKDGRANDIRKNLVSYYFKHPGKFFLRLLSLLKDGFTIKYMVAVFEKN